MTKDLLQYSKITSEKREIIPVNFEHVLDHALKNLKVQIEENKAVITHDPLPTIQGDEKLKVQLFQTSLATRLNIVAKKNLKSTFQQRKKKSVSF